MQKEILKAQIEALQDSIMAKQNVITATIDVIAKKREELAEMEKEKSAAEEWVEDNTWKYWGTQKLITEVKFGINAHEAGQAYTHEIYKRAVDRFKKSYNPELNTRLIKFIRELENINQPTQEHEPGIVGEMLSCTNNGKYYHSAEFSLYTPNDFDACVKKYKLTPIED